MHTLIIRVSLVSVLFASVCIKMHFGFPFDEKSETFPNDAGDLIEKTRTWVENEQCAHYREFNESRTRRTPLTTLSQFGASFDQSKRMSTFAHVCENITATYGHRLHTRSVLDEIAKMCSSPDETPSCYPLSRYTKPDGMCNNPIFPHRGKSFTPLKRYLKAAYADDLSQPRLTQAGEELPSARKVSSTVFTHETVEMRGYTSLVTHFGQLLDHDIGHTPTEVGNCGCSRSSICLPIEVPASDPFFEVPCFPFLRSLPVLGEDCQPGPRQQLNQVTSLIDGSVTYGSSAEVEESLRDKSHGMGLLLMSRGANDFSLPHLPKDVQMSDCISFRATQQCGRSGDKRAAEQPGLTALHTLFHRLHNHIALQLFQLNRAWDEEKLYQEARKIVTAIFQHIVYNEYLPLLLGPRIMGIFELLLNPDGFFHGYDHKIHPAMTNVLSTSAIRMGHSQVSHEMIRLNNRFEPVFDPLPLTEAFFNGTLMFDESNGGIDALVFGMLVERLLKVDTNIESALTHHLFNLPPGTPSLDLISFNIQRGRDHGLPSYTEWRRFCGSPAVTSFEDLKADFDQDVINRLQQVYTDVHDIDVFVGSIAERLLDDALVGPLNVCLLARQFRELKLGDRFWYENGGFISSFTKDQLKSIRAMTMSRVMCDTLETIDSIQPFAFRESDEAIGDGDTTSFSSYSKLHTYPNMQRELPGFANVRVSCQDGTAIPHLDLTAWKD